MTIRQLHNLLQYNLHYLIPAEGRLPRNTTKKEKAPLPVNIYEQLIITPTASSLIYAYISLFLSLLVILPLMAGSIGQVLDD